MPRLAFFAPLLLTLATLPSFSHGEPSLREAASLQFQSGFSGPPAAQWPADAPPVRFYVARGAAAPSCGLWLAARSQVLPLVEPDGGSDFPQCIGVPAAMVLPQGSQRFLLLRVKQRDTREDTSLTDLLFLDAGDVPQARDDLSPTTVPDTTKPLTQVAAWLRAHWVHQADPTPGARALAEHTATTPDAYLAVSQRSDGTCQYAAGTPLSPAPLLKATHACERVLATSAFQQGASSWLLVLFKRSGAGTEALVFEVNAQGAREWPDLAAELKTQAAEGKVLPLRQALQRRVAGMRR